MTTTPQYRVTTYENLEGEVVDNIGLDKIISDLLAIRRIQLADVDAARIATNTAGGEFQVDGLIIERLPDAVPPPSRHTARLTFDVSWIGHADAEAVLRKLDELMDVALHRARTEAPASDLLKAADIEVMRFELNIGAGHRSKP